MTEYTLELGAIVSRLERVEKENRRLRPRAILIPTSFLALLLAGATGINSLPHSAKVVHASADTPPGFQPYTPTRIEWFALEMQSALRDNSNWEYAGYNLDIAFKDAETIVMIVTYKPNCDRAAMNQSIDVARRIIQWGAKSHGWDNWIKVKEDVRLVTQLH